MADSLEVGRYDAGAFVLFEELVGEACSVPVYPRATASEKRPAKTWRVEGKTVSRASFNTSGLACSRL